MARKRTTLPAKLTRPWLHAPIRRERLYRLLDDARSHPVVWIVAPPGAGKTTLAAGYLEARGLPALWYQMDAADADPALFFYYLGLARNAISPAPKPPLPQITPAHLGTLASSARSFFRAVFARLPSPFVVLLDNYQETPDAGPTHHLISEGLREIPPDVTVLILSRSEPPKEFARLLASQSLTIVDFENLKFTLEETQALIQSTGRSLNPAMAGNVHARTDGWAAGVVLLLEHTRRHELGTAATHAPSMEGLFHYFATEAFESLPQAIRDLLVATAILPRMTTESAIAISTNSEAGTVLETLFRRRLFIDRRDTGQTTYAYHALFREFLLERGRQTLGATGLAHMHAEAARIMESSGARHDAIDLYLSAQDYREAVRLILQETRQMLPQGGRTTVAQWIARLPDAIRAESGWLLLWSGMGQLGVDVPASRKLLNSARARFVQEGNLVGRLICLYWLLVSYFAIERNNLHAMDPWIAELAELLTGDLSRVPEDVQYETLGGLISALIARRPNWDFLTESAGRMMAMIASLAPRLNPAMGAVPLMIYLRWIGDIAMAERVAHVVQPALSRPMEPLVKIYWLINHAYMRTDLLAELGPATESQLEQAAALAEAEELRFVLPGVNITQLNLLVNRGDHAAAETLARQLDRTLDSQAGYERTSLHALRACLALQQGDVAGALTQSKTAIAIARAGGLVQLHAYARLIAALTHAEAHEFEPALECLREAHRDMTGEFLAFNVGLIRAHIALLMHDDASANTSLNTAFALGRAQGYRNTWFWIPRIMAVLCAHACRNNIETTYATRLVRERRLLPPDSSCEHWPWPIRIHTLGRFSVVIDDEPLSSAGKTPKKPLELIKAILSHGSRGVNQDALAGLLWADLDGDAARNALNVALHRIRKLLRYEDFIRVEDGNLHMNESLVWCDTWGLARLAAEVERLTSGVARIEEYLALAQRVLRVYGGHYLDGEGASWVIAARERLRSQFLRIVAAVSRHLERQAHWDEATSLYRRAIELDPLAEEFHRGLMRCLKGQDRIAEALDAYRRCRDLLFVNLGVEPSPATQALHRSLSPR